MMLHDARREARLDAAGDLVVLEDQNRSLWNQQQISSALPLVEEALTGSPRSPGKPRGPGPFALQAAIVAVHCRAKRAEDTDWREIVRLYDLLEQVQPSPIVSLNRAVAVAMAEGPSAGLAQIEAIPGIHDLENYHLLHAARADLLRRLGSTAEAAKSYRRALALVSNDRERRYLEKRLAACS